MARDRIDLRFKYLRAPLVSLLFALGVPVFRLVDLSETHERTDALLLPDALNAWIMNALSTIIPNAQALTP